MGDSEVKPTVLLVDDEEMVLTLGRVILERSGYEVLLANSGAEALVICEARTTAPDCVVIDCTLPGMSGRTTLEEIRKRFPDVPALISSGHNIQRIEDEMRGISLSGIIHKPYRSDALISGLKGALTKPPIEM